MRTSPRAEWETTRRPEESSALGARRRANRLTRASTICAASKVQHTATLGGSNGGAPNHKGRIWRPPEFVQGVLDSGSRKITKWPRPQWMDSFSHSKNDQCYSSIQPGLRMESQLCGPRSKPYWSPTCWKSYPGARCRTTQQCTVELSRHQRRIHTKDE